MNRQLAVVEDEPQALAPAGLFRTDDPSGIVARATAVANALKRVVDDRKLTTRISGRDHVRVEGWSLLGTLVGVFPVPVTVDALPDGKGYMAHVEARTLAGAVVGSAFALCSRDEPTWRDRPDYALASMAQTRATGKALRLPLGFVMTLAGYEATPAEEMDGIEGERTQRQPRPMSATGQPMRRTAPQRPAPAPIEGTATPTQPPITDEQKAEIKAVAAERLMISWHDVVTLCREHFGKGPAALSKAEAAQFIAVMNEQAGLDAEQAEMAIDAEARVVESVAH